MISNQHKKEKYEKEKKKREREKIKYNRLQLLHKTSFYSKYFSEKGKLWIDGIINIAFWKYFEFNQSQRKKEKKKKDAENVKNTFEFSLYKIKNLKSFN